MKKVILYSSNQIKKVPLTGGIRRFLELATNLGNYCDLTVMTGDEFLELPDNVRHISTNQQEILTSEKELAYHNKKKLLALKKEGYDWIIAFDVPPAVWLAMFHMPNLCLMVRKDFIGYENIILQEKEQNRFKRYTILKAFLLAELVTLIHAKIIIVQCKYDKNTMLERHKLFSGIIKKKIAIQINNVDPSWAKSSCIHKEKHSSGFSVGTVNGFADLRKGCDIFLEAVSSIIDRGVFLDAYIAGDGRLLEEYKEKYKAYTSIHFLGRITKPADFTKQLDLAVVPSRADSCPNTVMEALINGVPVIASNVGGIPEILDDTTALFEPNYTSLAEKILYFTNHDMLSELSSKQKNRCKELQFDWVKSIFDIINGGLNNEK